MTCKDYVVATGNTPLKLAEAVCKYREDGFVLHGSPFVFKGKICQAMTEPEDVN